MYGRSVEVLSKIHDLLPQGGVEPSEDLEESCEYLRLDEGTSEKVVKATLVLTLFTSIICITSLIILFGKSQLSFTNSLVLLTLPVLTNHFYSNYYKNKYYEERVKDLSELPDFFTLLITYLKINPNLENALMKVNTLSHGRVSVEVSELVKRLKQGREWSVKTSFLEIMKEFNNASVNSATNSLISALSLKTKTKRDKLLNKSLHHLLKGVVEQTKRFSREIYTPIILLFGFGTIIPLIIISITPLLGLFKNTVLDLKTIILVFASSLIITRLVINNLKKKSPPRFSQLKIKEEVKGVNPFLLGVLFLGISSPTIIFILSNYFPFHLTLLEGYNTLFMYAGLSTALGLYYYSKTHSLIKKKERMMKLEDELVQTFFLLGSRINEGHSVEESLEHVSKVVSEGECKSFLKEVYNNIKHKGLSVKESFRKVLEEKEVTSERLKGLINLFITSVKKHSLSASENIIEICDYYESIKNAESEMMNTLSKNMDMIRLTSYFFTPVICALIINIQRLINSKLLNESLNMLSLTFQPVSTEWVQLIISLYVLLLSLTLSNLHSFLTNNNEKVSTWHNYYKTLIVSGSVFTATLIISKILLFKL